MKAIHPDRQRPERRSAAEEQAKKLNAAYAVLANPVKRRPTTGRSGPTSSKTS
jgi:curved DNA-binding protein CbpA